MSMLLLSNCHRTAIVMMLQKNCVTPPKNEEVGIVNGDVKKKKDTVLVWAEYIVVCHKTVINFSSQKHFLYIL